jgi:DNA-binding transcriptional LysR family regulator
MDMKTSCLETLLWVVHLGGIGAAAEKLNLTQPAISRRIHQLEQELGAKLFLRQGRGIVLTPVGRTCIEFAQRIVSDITELKIATGGNGSIAGTVRVGVGEVAALTWLHRLLVRIREVYPNLHLEIDVDLSHRLIQKLSNRTIELAMLPGTVSLPGAVVSKLGDYTLKWMASRTLIRQNGCLSAADLVDMPIVTLSEGARTQVIMDSWFQLANLKPRRVHYCNSLSVIASLVRDGFGISLLPLVIFRDWLTSEAVVALEIEPPVTTVDYWVAYLQGPETPVLEEIAALTRQESQRELQPGY